jgi:hypothetical protein
VATLKEKRRKARAAWRKWYWAHHEEAKKYYRIMFGEKVADETSAEREIRLAQARKNQKAYAARKKKAKVTNVRSPRRRRNNRG